MEHNDYHFHWWHWLVIIAVILFGLGIAYTWINNTKNDDSRSYVRGVEQTIEHPIDATQNTINDIEKK